MSLTQLKASYARKKTKLKTVSMALDWQKLIGDAKTKNNFK